MQSSGMRQLPAGAARVMTRNDAVGCIAINETWPTFGRSGNKEMNLEDVYEETWVTLSDGQSMCALINGPSGWLLHMPDRDGESFSSRNPNYEGAAEDQIEYRLNNGQFDAYPASWALPTPCVRRGLQYFENQRARAPFITWSKD